MVGFKPQTTSPSSNFTILKTDPAGTFSTSAFPFRSGYQIMLSPGCGTMAPSQLTTCAGVSAIETTIPGNPSAWYAIAGASDETAFFATLDAVGNPINSKAYLFPYTCSNCIEKPLITESASSPNNYYICGGFDTSIYVLKVNAAGAIAWSSYYSIGHGNYFKPKGIIECPFTGDLLLVGGVNPPAAYNRGTDGFFLKLNPANGNVISYRTYSLPFGACQEFTCIKPAYSLTGGQGFVLGGFTDNFPGAPWFTKLNPNGDIIWSTVVKPTTDAGALPVTGIIERLNQTQHEYYASVRSYFNGMLVLKLNDNGIPFVGSSNEFLFNAGAAAASCPISIDFENSGNHIGLCTYGTDDVSNGGHLYMVRSYFNGISGCNETFTTVAAYYPGPDSIISPWINKYGSLNGCSNFQLSSASLSQTLTSICSNTFIPGGNNNILTGIEAEFSEKDQNYLIYPNPSTGLIWIYDRHKKQGSFIVNLYTSMGRLIKHAIVLRSMSEEKYEIDLTFLDLNEGLYILEITDGSSSESIKISYRK
jgi:hypothetical protein